MVKNAKKPPAKKAHRGRPKKTKKTAAKASRKKPAIVSHVHAKVPGSFQLTGQAFLIVSSFWRTIGGIYLVYLLLSLFFANGISAITSNISFLNDRTVESGRFSQALVDFESLAGSRSGQEVGSALQAMLFIVASLAVIWALRQLLAGEKAGIKQAFYQGMAPLVPFVLLLLVTILQLLPMTIGAALLGIVITGAFGWLITTLFSVLFLLLTTWTLYMLSSSIIALYIVTLPEMEPRKALQSAKSLVRNRRFIIMRRLLFLPFLIVFGLAALFIPVLLLWPPIVPPLFFAAAALAVFVGHTYLYNLYRRLLV